MTARQRPERHLLNILECTRGILFIGTPHHGLGLASWAEQLARSLGLIKQTNPQIVEVLRSDSEVLARIQDSFHTMIRARNQAGGAPIEITCFYEELPLVGIDVVGQMTNTLLQKLTAYRWSLHTRQSCLDTCPSAYTQTTWI